MSHSRKPRLLRRRTGGGRGGQGQHQGRSSSQLQQPRQQGWRRGGHGPASRQGAPPRAWCLRPRLCGARPTRRRTCQSPRPVPPPHHTPCPCSGPWAGRPPSLFALWPAQAEARRAGWRPAAVAAAAAAAHGGRAALIADSFSQCPACVRRCGKAKGGQRVPGAHLAAAVVVLPLTRCALASPCKLAPRWGRRARAAAVATQWHAAPCCGGR